MQYTIEFMVNGGEYTSKVVVDCDDLRQVGSDVVLVDDKNLMRFEEELVSIKEGDGLSWKHVHIAKVRKE